MFQFVIQGNEISAEKIRSMARHEMAPENRVIVCLEESGRDWNLSIARPIGMLDHCPPFHIETL